MANLYAITGLTLRSDSPRPNAALDVFCIYSIPALTSLVLLYKILLFIFYNYNIPEYITHSYVSSSK